MRMINEYEMREALLKLLNVQLSDQDAVVVEELGIEHGSSRIDVAVVNDKLIGYEIKSDYDNLLRLPGQIHAYNRVFNEINIVTGAEFIYEINELIGSWWGVRQANVSKSGAVTLEPIREAKANPGQSSLSLASLLWKNEAADILSHYIDRTPPVSWTKRRLYFELFNCLDLQGICEVVCMKLRTRTEWRNSLPSTPGGGSLRPSAM